MSVENAKSKSQIVIEQQEELLKRISGLTKQVEELHGEVHKVKEPDQGGSQRLDVRSDGHLAIPSGSTPTPYLTGGHRTAREILDCPTCSKAIKDELVPKVEKEMRQKYGNIICGKGHKCFETDEACPECGDKSGTRIKA